MIGKQALSAAGQATGSFQTAEGTTRGFVYSDQRALDIGALGGNYSTGLAINNGGKATGIAETATGARHAFLYSAGSMTDLGTLGGTISIGYAINDNDAVTGAAQDSSGVLRAFVHTKGQMVDLGALVASLGNGTVVDSAGTDINNAGVVLGRYVVGNPADPSAPTTVRAFFARPVGSIVAQLFEALLRLITGLGLGNSLLSNVEGASALQIQTSTQAIRLAIPCL